MKVGVSVGAGAVAILLATAGVAVLWLKFGDRITSGAKAALDKVNPASENNVVNTTVNSGVSAVTGRDETLGGWLYDLTHADPTKDTQTAAPTSDGIFIYDPMGNIIGSAQ